jgi:hypothetical protein
MSSLGRDWNNLIQKEVKTKDLRVIGNIIMVDNEFITVLEGTRQDTEKAYSRTHRKSSCTRSIY